MWNENSHTLDEANLMHDLVMKDSEGQIVANSMSAWFVAMTKEMRKFHITLCSGDRFSSFVVGHLSYDEAKVLGD